MEPGPPDPHTDMKTVKKKKVETKEASKVHLKWKRGPSKEPPCTENAQFLSNPFSRHLIWGLLLDLRQSQKLLKLLLL